MMSNELLCWQCGASLAQLSLPLARLDECPSCSADLHVCRLCVNYAPALPRGCREDGAEEVRQKDRANFCDWFKPAPGAFDAARRVAQQQAEARLGALFGAAPAPEPDADDRPSAEDLFRKRDP